LLLRITRLLVLILFWILTCTCRAKNGPDGRYIYSV
jgi:hypothetical protein